VALAPEQYTTHSQQLAVCDIVDIGLFTLESALHLTPKQRHIACAERLPPFSNMCCQRYNLHIDKGYFIS
jgi:hypothetical protein